MICGEMQRKPRNLSIEEAMAMHFCVSQNKQYACTHLTLSVLLIDFCVGFAIPEQWHGLSCRLNSGFLRMPTREQQVVLLSTHGQAFILCSRVFQPANPVSTAHAPSSVVIEEEVSDRLDVGFLVDQVSLCAGHVVIGLCRLQREDGRGQRIKDAHTLPRGLPGDAGQG